MNTQPVRVPFALRARKAVTAALSAGIGAGLAAGVTALAAALPDGVSTDEIGKIAAAFVAAAVTVGLAAGKAVYETKANVPDVPMPARGGSPL